MILFGGLLINSSTVPVYLVWIQYISPVYYSFAACTRAQYDKEPFPFDKVPDDMGFILTPQECMWALIALAVAARLASILALKLNIEKFQ